MTGKRNETFKDVVDSSCVDALAQSEDIWYFTKMTQSLFG